MCDLYSFSKIPEIKQPWWKSQVFMSYLSALKINGCVAVSASIYIFLIYLIF